MIHSGILAALGAALLFGASVPLAKMLPGHADPWLLAGTLYAGSGLGIWGLRAARGVVSPPLVSAEYLPLAGAVVSGGVVAPVLFMAGVLAMPAASAALLLNAESVFTALLAWLVFKESTDRRVICGMAAVTAGAVLLSWPAEGAPLTFGTLWPSSAILGACLAWGIDNNLTNKVSYADAGRIAMIKGLTSGGINLTLALALGASVPSLTWTACALALGFFSYGAGLILFIIGLRHLGAARTGAYFASAPFFGALLSLALLHEPTPALWAPAALLMAVGVGLYVIEGHGHEHTHEPMEHTHEHVHGLGDDHHDHTHEPHMTGGLSDPLPPGFKHTHPHRHERLTHTHAHFPDAHHRHKH